MKNPVRETTLPIVRNAQYVRINHNKIDEFVRALAKKKIIIPPWPKTMHFETADCQKMLDYLILLDALNFCFWTRKGEKWHIFLNGKKYDGYFALSLSLKKFFKTNPAKASLMYFSYIPFSEFKTIFSGGKNLLFFKKRWFIARAVSKAVLKKYGNSERFVLHAKGKFSTFLSQIVRDLPSFNDYAYYFGEKVFILKRAQILGADIFGAFHGKGIGRFTDKKYLTAFADYKVPQILHSLGILEYTPALQGKIVTHTLIPQGSRAEVEIRSATIWAVEYLRQALLKYGKKLYSYELDWILWNRSQQVSMKYPYHLTKTIFY